VLHFYIEEMQQSPISISNGLSGIQSARVAGELLPIAAADEHFAVLGNGID